MNELINIIHRRAKQPTPVACAARKSWRFEEFETLPAGTKPRTSQHRSPGGERRGNRRRQTIFLERTREGHRHSDELWNCIKGLKVSETVNYDYGMHGDWYDCGDR